MATRVAREAVVALAVTLAVALVGAAVVGGRVAAANAYWQAGYLRLLGDCVTERFDVAAPVAGAVALGAAAVLAALAWRGAPLPVLARPRAWRVALVVLGVVAGLRVLAAADAWQARRGPNVVLVSIDTLRADHLGAYGYGLPTSPTIDGRLAAEGVTFEDVFSQSPKTTPSHMTMLTSLYPAVHGVELWEDRHPGHVLNPAVHTLAEVLKDAGYATAAFTGGANVHRSRGFDQGFDVYKHGDQVARASRWVRDHRSRKFFLFLHTYDVHDPYVPPPQWVERFAPDLDGPLLAAVNRLRAQPAGWWPAHRLFWQTVDRSDARDVAFVERLYDGAIRHMDEATIAPLLDLLDALGLAADTLVVFTSDHGEAFNEHGVFLHDDLFAGTLRVPLILRFPGRLPAGRRVAARARLLDVMPTILALVGVQAPSAVQGRSLVPSIGAAGVAPSSAVVSEYDRPEARSVFESVRRDDLAYIVANDTEQLFDVARDPGEQTNLAAARPEVTASMREELARWRAACEPLAARLAPRGPAVNPDADTTRQLRALGYVQ